MKCATLLCVDDNAAILRFYLILLSRYGYDVLPARDGTHALEVFRAYAGKINAVILDYQMPGMNGLELAASLKRTAPSLPILMISTAPPLPEEMSPFVDATITKGTPVRHILTQLERLLADHRSRQSMD
jgi:CheY-like chemotaxis protein